MKYKKAGSVVVTVLCAGMILGAGYFGIVKGGKMVLENEEKPKRENFENTSSNVFVGKIEDDIQLFPWNYYGKNEVQKTLEKETGITEQLELMQEKVYSMEAVHCGVDRETIDMVYGKKGSTILENMRAFDTDYGEIFFYQDTLEVQGKQYQVKTAFSDYAIYNFTCRKGSEGDVNQTEDWKEGKEKLRRMLEKYPIEVYTVMYNVQELGYDGLVYDKDIFVVNSSENSEGNLESVFEENYGAQMKNLQKMLSVNNDYDIEVLDEIRSEQENNLYWDMEKCSYQMIEINDMILVLVQGEYICEGIYYDPLTQTFCGYNMFL